MSSELKEKINKALTFHERGDFLEAERLYKEVLETDEKNSSALNLYGLLKYQNKEFDNAAELIKQAIEISPCAYFWGNLARVYFKNENFKEAINANKKAIEFEPDNFDAWFNLALVLKNDSQIEESIEAYKKALLLNPYSYDANFNLGSIYYFIKNDPATAAIYFKKAVEIYPDDMNANYFLSISLIKIKNFKDGWKHYEYRISRETSIFSQNLSLGNNLINSKLIWSGNDNDTKDKTIFVYYEAGYGDTIMFARFVPLLKDKFAKVLFKPQISSIDLFKESFDCIEILDKTSFTKPLDFDYHLPVMSLPYALQMDSEEQIPFPDKYLKTNPDKVKFYKENYFNNDKFKIGIKWQGNTHYDEGRKISLEYFYKLFELPNTKFYSVQKGEGIEQLEQCHYDLMDLGETFNDFSDTAAALENLDLIICNDTSVANLAGALGKPCWMLLPFVQNWRWHTDTSYSPWYKSIKMFRQNEPENWSDVFDSVEQELKKIL